MRHGAALLVCGALAAPALAAPATAGAAASATPPGLDFGSVPVGTTSAPQPVTLTQTCTVFDFAVTNTCLTTGTDVWTLAPAASGDFAVSNNLGSPCGSSLQPVASPSVGCVLDLTFTPTATGARAGTLSTGTTVLPPAEGPTVALAGTGTTPSGGGTATGTPTGTSGTPAGTTGTKRKCKKSRAAQTAKKKKCRKRK